MRAGRIGVAGRGPGDQHGPRRDGGRHTCGTRQRVIASITTAQADAAEVDGFARADIGVGKRACDRANAGRDRVARNGA